MVKPFKNDWITYKCVDQSFYLDFGPFPSTYGKGFTYAVGDLRDIYSKYKRPLALTLSGGVDSQSVVLAAHASGVPFDVYSLRFMNGLNAHDLSAGQELCDRLKIKIRYVDLDIIKFFTGGKYLNYVAPYQNGSPQMSAFMWFYDQIARANIVIGSGNPVIKSPEKYTGMNNYTLFSWERFARNKFPMIGFFLWYSPELFGSLYTVHPGDYHLTTEELYMVKCKTYVDNGFDIIPQADKFNGFEKVKEVFFKMYPKTGTPFDTFYRYPHNQYNKTNFITGLGDK